MFPDDPSHFSGLHDHVFNNLDLVDDFGCQLDLFVFESLTLSTSAKMRDIVETALILHEPRIDVHEVIISRDEYQQGRILIRIDYSVRSTNSRYNFVYPFYQQEGTDINL